MNSYRYSGAVVELGTRRGLAGARVEVWDVENICHDLVDCEFTDADGAFAIVLSSSLVRELFLSRSPTVYFKVFAENTLVADTRNHLIWHISETHESGRIEVPPEGKLPTGEPAPWVVWGTVTHARTGPIPGAIIRAAHKGVRSETELGRSTTDMRGMYQITYHPEVLLRFGKHKADLAVSVLDAKEAHLADAQVVFGAPATAKIDVLVGGPKYLGPPEVDTILQTLRRAAEDLRPATLSSADQKFLASAERLDGRALATLVAADKLAGDAGDATVALYGAGRGGASLTIEGIFPPRSSSGSLPAVRPSCLWRC
jgi:hypothetical protein